MFSEDNDCIKNDFKNLNQLYFPLTPIQVLHCSLGVCVNRVIAHSLSQMSNIRLVVVSNNIMLSHKQMENP